MITPRQHHVLSVLFTRGPSHCNDWAAWYPLDSRQVYGIISRLEKRKYVEVAGMHLAPRSRPARIYKITDKGCEALREWDREKDALNSAEDATWD